jgi:hypothetical protein
MANTNICQTRHPIDQWIAIIIGSSYWSMVQAVDIYKISNNEAIQPPLPPSLRPLLFYQLSLLYPALYSFNKVQLQH